MIVHQDFRNDCLPPRVYLMQCMDSLMATYCFLWEHKDSENKLTMTWNDLSKLFSKNSFRSSLRKLFSKGLISYDESKDGFFVECVGWDSIE